VPVLLVLAGMLMLALPPFLLLEPTSTLARFALGGDLVRATAEPQLATAYKAEATITITAVTYRLYLPPTVGAGAGVAWFAGFILVVVGCLRAGRPPAPPAPAPEPPPDPAG
jgi:hypothetical protein